MKKLNLLLFLVLWPFFSIAQNYYSGNVGDYISLPEPTLSGGYEIYASEFYSTSPHLDVYPGTNRVKILSAFNGYELAQCDYYCVRQYTVAGHIYEDYQNGTAYYYISCTGGGGGGGGNGGGTTPGTNPNDYDNDYGSWGIINIKIGETKTVYSNISPPNPSKLVSVIWSDYGQLGYVIESQNSSSCTIRGSYTASNQKLWCLWKYGNSTYKNYYYVNVTKPEKETLSLTANPAGGTLNKGGKVHLTPSVTGSDIYYTLNGDMPTTSSTKYTSSGITINESCTLKAFAKKSGYYDSPVMSWDYTVDKTNTIEINATNFPDETFRNYLLSLSCGSDGKLTESEIKNITSIDVSGTESTPGKITSLKGIEYFTSLQQLYCIYNQLTNLDMTKNTALKNLYCYNNQLTALDVSKNTALIKLGCGYNQLSTLDVSKNTTLEILNCYNNQLTTLDISKNTALTSLHCHNNQLTALDVSKNTALIDFGCATNQLTALNVSNNTALTWLSCASNQLSTFDVSNNTALTSLYCNYNQLTALDLSKNTTLENLSCGVNQLTALDVSKNTALKTLSCPSNQLTALDVSKNTALTSLYCYQNQIKGTAMDNVINGLPTNTSGKTYEFRVYLPSDYEGNVCTTIQVAAAKTKGWMPKYYNSESVRWEDYEGSDPSGIHGVLNDEHAIDAPVFNLSGQQLTAPQKGINIVNGRKIVVK